MRRYLSAFALLCFVASAQAQTPATRAALETQNNIEIYSNGTGQVTGQVLNGLLGNFAASMATQLDPNTFTQQQTYFQAPIFQSLNGYVYCNGTSQCSASPTILPSAIPLQVGTTNISNAAFNGVLFNNGGTLGSITATTNGVLCTSNTGLPSICAILPPISGGTGISSPNLYNFLIGNGASPMVQLPPSATAGVPIVSLGVSANPGYGTALVAGGGTGCTVASGICLDNISAFSSLGFLTRTGSGAYAFQSATNGITNGNLSQGSAATIKGNPSASSANETDFTIQGLTNLASPNATLDYIPIYDHVTGTIKNATPSAVATATTGVSSLNSATGALTLSGANGINIGTSGTTVTASLDTSLRAPPVRQTVNAGPATAGAPTFLPSTSGTLGITTQNISSTAPFVISAANGDGPATFNQLNITGGTTANFSWTGLTASTTNYLYETLSSSGGVVTLTPSSTTLQPIYQYGGTISTTNNQFTFDYQAMIGYMGNGSTAPQASIVFVGEVVTSGSAVTSSVAYAYNGYYDSGYISTLPAIATLISKASNIGVDSATPLLTIKNLTAEQGYSIGDIIIPYTAPSSAYSAPFTPGVSRNIAFFTTGSNGGVGFYINNKTSGAAVATTPADWAYRLQARRQW